MKNNFILVLLFLIFGCKSENIQTLNDSFTCDDIKTIKGSELYKMNCHSCHNDETLKLFGKISLMKNSDFIKKLQNNQNVATSNQHIIFDNMSSDNLLSIKCYLDTDYGCNP